MAAVWIDAQLSPGLAVWFREALAVDAYAVRDLELHDADDPTVFDRARATAAMVLTKDRDFVELVSRRGPPPQIVWLTCGNTSNAHLCVLLADAWPRVFDLLQAGEPLIEIGGIAS